MSTDVSVSSSTPPSPAYLEHLQDQATQVRDSREALDALRREYAEQHRREQEEAHRQRQIQMMQKVEVLRQQKRVRPFCLIPNELSPWKRLRYISSW